MSNHRRIRRALDRIAIGLAELEDMDAYRALPQEAKDLIDNSALQYIDAAGVRRLALDLDAITETEVL